MDYGKHIGRVGGLAVALGIGAAIVGMPAASADDTASAPKSSSESASSSSLPATKASRSRGADTETSSGGTESNGSEESADPDVSEDESEAEPDSAEDPDVTAPDEDADEDADVESEADPVVVETPRAGTSDDEVPADEPASSAETPATDEAPQQVDEDAAQPTKEAATDEVVEVVDAGTPADLPAVPTSSSTTADVTAEAPRTLFDVVNNVIKAIVGPFANPFPTTPDSSPMLLMLEWFRRTTVGMIYNRSPIGKPLQIGEAADGTVIGTVGGIDPDGDPLTYEVAEGPKYGTLVMNADGTYVYTPGSLLARDGGNDSFVVVMRDNGIRILSRPGVSTVSVSVTVGAGDELGIGGSPYGLAMSPDRRLAYVTDIDNHRVVVVDVAAGSVIDSIDVGAAPYGITVASDGRAYVVNSDDGTVSVIDTETNTLLPGTIFVGNSPTSAAVNATGTRVVITASNDDAVAIIDTQTMKVTRVMVGDGAFGVAIKDDKAFVTNEFDDTVSVIDLNTNTVVKTIAVGNAPAGIAVGGNRVVVTNSGSLSATADGSVTIIDLDTLTVIGEPIALGEMPTSVVVDADGKFAYVTDAAFGTVTVIDLIAGRVNGPVLETVAGATGIDIGFDGRLFVAGTHSGTIGAIAPAVGAVGSILPVSNTRASATVAAAQQSMLAAADTPGGATWTREFYVHNLTTDIVNFIGYDSDERPDQTVPLGFPIPPGGKMRFEVPMYYFSRVSVRPIFQNKVTGDTWTVRLNTNFDVVYAQDSVYVRHSGGTGTSTPSPTDWIASAGNSVTLREKRDNLIEIDAGDPKATEWINKLCNGGGSAVSCRPANITKIDDSINNFSDPQLGQVKGGGPSIDNNATPGSHEYSGELSATWSTKASIEGSVKLSLSLAKVLTSELSAKIGKEVSESATYKGTVKYSTPPWTKVTVTVQMPVVTVTSDMYITIGNTTVVVKGVTYDVPSPRTDVLKQNTVATPSDPAGPTASV